MGLGDGMNLKKLIKEAQKAQAKAAEIQARLAEARVEGSAGGGLVRAVADGHGRIVELEIRPEAVDPDDVEALADLVLVAVQDAQEKARELAEREMQGSLGALGGLLGGGF